MSSTVVVVGRNALNTTDPRDLVGQINQNNYGNRLPEFWSRTAGIVKSTVNQATTDPVLDVLAQRNYTVVTEGATAAIIRGLDPVEAGGSLFSLKCLRCKQDSTFPLAGYAGLSGVPQCPRCGKDRTRPNFSLHGEPSHHRRQIEKLLDKATCLLFLGVEHDSHLASLAKRVPMTTLISENPWGSFCKVIEHSPAEWARGGGHI